MLAPSLRGYFPRSMQHFHKRLSRKEHVLAAIANAPVGIVACDDERFRDDLGLLYCTVARSKNSLDLSLFDAAITLQNRGAAAIIFLTEISQESIRGVALELKIPVFSIIDGHMPVHQAIAEARKIISEKIHDIPISDIAARKSFFKVGVIGGVGPAATVDFIRKLVSATPATRDQEHIKLVIEQNPQIPDRTLHLLGLSTENPSIALYAAALSLVDNGASVIVIPCNTAHAYVPEISERISVPIVNMLDATINHVIDTFGRNVKVGLLATSGTISSGVYHRAAAARKVDLITPDEEHQMRVMDAIYAEDGIKAGFIDGRCKDNLVSAIDHLVKAHAEVIILGCTELPLVVEQQNDFIAAERAIALIDPTKILAERCVALWESADQ